MTTIGQRTFAEAKETMEPQPQPHPQPQPQTQETPRTFADVMQQFTQIKQRQKTHKNQTISNQK